MIPVTGLIVGQSIVLPVYFTVGDTYVMTVPVYNQEQITTFTDLSNTSYPASLGQGGILSAGYFAPSVSFYFTFSGTGVTVVPVNPASVYGLNMAQLFEGTLSPVFDEVTSATISASAAPRGMPERWQGVRVSRLERFFRTPLCLKVASWITYSPSRP